MWEFVVSAKKNKGLDCLAACGGIQKEQRLNLKAKPRLSQGLTDEGSDPGHTE